MKYIIIILLLLTACKTIDLDPKVTIIKQVIKVDVDRINDEATHLILTKKLSLEKDKFYSQNVRITYEEL